MHSPKIVLLCMASAIIYGIGHDQVTARVCVEYFTIGHAPLFPTASPTLLALLWDLGNVVGRPDPRRLGRVGLQGRIVAEARAADLTRPIACLLSSWQSPHCWRESPAISLPRPAHGAAGTVWIGSQGPSLLVLCRFAGTSGRLRSRPLGWADRLCATSFKPPNCSAPQQMPGRLARTSAPNTRWLSLVAGRPKRLASRSSCSCYCLPLATTSEPA